MKKNVSWLLLVTTYLFSLVVAFSHDWDWMELSTSQYAFTDRWFVNTTQVAVFAIPTILFAVWLANQITNGIPEAIREGREDAEKFIQSIHREDR